MAQQIIRRIYHRPKPKKTRQGLSYNTKYGLKNSKKYKKKYRGQGK